MSRRRLEMRKMWKKSVDACILMNDETEFEMRMKRVCCSQWGKTILTTVTQKDCSSQDFALSFLTHFQLIFSALPTNDN